jgi:hypothetical protein
MSKDENFWRRFGGMIRKASDDCPITPAQAQNELDALLPADEKPLGADDIESIIAKVRDEDFDPEPAVPNTEWVDSYTKSDVEEDVFALNRNKGEPDPEVDAKVEELRKRAANEEGDEEDKTRLEHPEKPVGEGGGGG